MRAQTPNYVTCERSTDIFVPAVLKALSAGLSVSSMARVLASAMQLEPWEIATVYLKH